MDGSITLREKQKQRTKLEIIKTAFDLFARHGFENVSVEMIAGAAGISRATFFNYFPQKELLLGEVAAARREQVMAALAQFAARKKTPALSDVVGLFVRMAGEIERVSFHAKALMLQTVLRAATQGALVAIKADVLRELTAVLARLQEEGKANAAVSPRDAAETLFAVYLATTIEWLVQPDLPEGWLARSARQRLETVLAGLQSRGGSK